MSKDYKGPAKKSGGGKGGAGSLLIGILIGLLMGLGIALAVAWYINKMPTPFVNRAPPPLKRILLPAMLSGTVLPPSGSGTQVMLRASAIKTRYAPGMDRRQASVLSS